MIWKVWVAATRWKNGVKSRAPRPRGLFNHRKLFVSVLKTLPNKLELVLSWRMNSTNLFLSVVKTLINTVVLFSNWHMHLKNCSKGFNGASGLWRWKSIGKVIQNPIVCEILRNLFNQNASMTIPYKVSWRKLLLLFEPLPYKTLTPRRDLRWLLAR